MTALNCRFALAGDGWRVSTLSAPTRGGEKAEKEIARHLNQKSALRRWRGYEALEEAR